MSFEVTGSSIIKRIEEDIQDSELRFNPLKYNSSLSSHKKTCSLVVPAYNEEARITPFLEDISENLPNDWEIIIICDGNDRTADIARSFGERFMVIEYDHKLGKGGAILEGFSKAKGEIVGYVDADGALGSYDIMRVFSKVSSQFPVAIASRYVWGSNIIEKQTFLRILLGRLYHYTTFAILGLRHKDTQCGLKAYTKDTINVIRSRMKLTNLSVDTAILYHCKLLNLRVVEVPVRWRNVGGSKFKPFKTAFLMFVTLVGLRMAHSKKAERLKKIFLELHEASKDF